VYSRMTFMAEGSIDADNMRDGRITLHSVSLIAATELKKTGDICKC
jgi:hypothetical protein